MKSRRITWMGHTARIGEGRGAKTVLVGKLRERDHLEDPAIDRRIIINWIFKIVLAFVGNWIDVVQNRDRWRAFVKTVVNPPISYNEGKYIDWLRTFWLLKKGTASWS
jgi:hypothetical protein